MRSRIRRISRRSLLHPPVVAVVALLEDHLRVLPLAVLPVVVHAVVRVPALYQQFPAAARLLRRVAAVLLPDHPAVARAPAVVVHRL